MTELFSQFDVDSVAQVLRQRGEPYGITFGDMDWLANSRLALEAAEFARDHGRYHDVHMALFKAYFSDGRNIGEIDVLTSVMSECGLDPEALVAALDDGRYRDRVKQGSAQAREAGVTAIPTFVIEGQPPITGAVNESLFREALQAAANAG